MGAQTRSLEDVVALTLPLPARLTFVLVFLVLQLYSFALQVYKVSQEGIPEQIKSLWQRWFLHWFFLGFLKKKRKIRRSQTANVIAPPAAPSPAGKSSADQANANGQDAGNSKTNGPNNIPTQPSESTIDGNATKPRDPPTPPAEVEEECAPSWTSLWVQGNTIALFLVGIALSIPTFNKLEIAQEGLNTETCTAAIDGDIAGDGVRAALWVQQGILWLSVFTGAFLKPSQPRPTAVKELAAGLVVTHLSLAIAVVVQIGQGTLTPLDAAIVVMMLDAQNAALAVSFSSRETLAARWEVVSVSVAQFFGLVVIGIVLARFEEGRLATPDCSCFSYFWWAWQSTCPSGQTFLPRAERAVLWIYYAFRWFNSAQNWHFGVRYMWVFNLMEQDKKLWDGEPPTSNSPEGTPGVPPSIGFSFLQNMVFGLVSSVAAELTITGYTSGEEPKPFTVGQITAMVIAVTTTLRATWLFIRRFDLLPMVEARLWSEGPGEMQQIEVVEGREGNGRREREGSLSGERSENLLEGSAGHVPEISSESEQGTKGEREPTRVGSNVNIAGRPS
ncbi:hypothetical protein OQA88_5288 [Cercophora sp. LCS_1]